MIDDVELIEEETIDIELDNDIITLGDMLKSVYDTNNNGIVDNAEKVNNHTVDIDVPENAKFTDTIYDDTQVKQDISNLQTNKADKSEIPTTLSDLTEDSTHKTVTDTEKSTWNNKIDNTVNNLLNYYAKSETFTKQEVNNLISAITTMDMQVVQELPTQDISTTTIYLVPKTTAETNNAYDEYIYISNSWEFIGSTEVDLTDYVKNTDYASDNTAGVIKVKNNYGLYISSSGELSGRNITYSQYENANNLFLISKAVLENVIAGKGLTTKAYVDGLVGDIDTILETLTVGNGV